jgi:anaerobic magnesium-protoporphyrin IX monomethyl ester cyclase
VTIGAPGRLLLINPRITSRRHARFPLSLMSLAAALEDRYRATLIDGNLDRDALGSASAAVKKETFDAVGVTVMGGPQVATAIEVSRAVRRARPDVPIVWGGYFPTLYPDVALNSDYVDFAIRGQGEDTFRELLGALAPRDEAALGARAARDEAALGAIPGLSWRRGDTVVNNTKRVLEAAHVAPALRYDLLADPRDYLARTFLGARTAGHQAALGCRFRCTFCGVAAMFNGATLLPPADRLDRDLKILKHDIGADSIQFFDHNFFDREADTIPLLEVLARLQLPWWCFARADALLNLSESSWALVRRSRLRMAYIGAESPSDWLLHDVRKGTRTDQTLEAVEICRRNGVIPELSFMLAPPHDPEGETEKTFEFIRHIKRVHPKSEIMLYVYAPLPPAPGSRNPHVERAVANLRDSDGSPLIFPTTADEWAQQKWLSYWCHTDTPWITQRLRERIRDFTTVLGCRFPTVTDVRSAPWGKVALRALSSWRYGLKRYGRPWELNISRRFIRLWDPRVSGL